MKCPLDFSDPMLNHVTCLVNLTLCTQDLGSETRQTLMPKMSQATGTPCKVSRILLKALFRHQSGSLNIFFCFPQKQNLVDDSDFLTGIPVGILNLRIPLPSADKIQTESVEKNQANSKNELAGSDNTLFVIIFVDIFGRNFVEVQTAAEFLKNPQKITSVYIFFGRISDKKQHH